MKNPDGKLITERNDGSAVKRSELIDKLARESAYGTLSVSTPQALKLAMELGFRPSHESYGSLFCDEGLMRVPNNIKHRDAYREERSAAVVSVSAHGETVTFLIRSRLEWSSGGHAMEIKVQARGAWKLTLERKAPLEA